MAELWKPKPIEVLKSWVEAIINEASDELTEWEATFINDMEDKLSRGYTLTQRQENRLEQIYAARTK